MNGREFAAKFLEDLIAFYGVNVLVEAREESDEAEDSGEIVVLNVPSTRVNGFLIGQSGENLRSLQNLTNMALKSNGYEDLTVTVDVAGYKKQRNQRLERDVQKQAEEVKRSGQDQALEPMNSYDRRIAHRAVGEVEGVESESVGEGKDRQVVIKKQTGQEASAEPKAKEDAPDTESEETSQEEENSS